MEPASEGDLVDRAVALAERLLVESRNIATRSERRQLARLGRLIDDERGRDLVQMLTDDVLRIHDPVRAARRFRDVVIAVGVPPSLGAIDALLLRMGAAVATIAPRLLMPLVVRRIRAETRGVVLSSNDPQFADHVKLRVSQGVDLNVNVLGEAILSDVGASERLTALRARLARPDVNYVSVKISVLCANLDQLAFDDSVDRVCLHLRTLYRDARAKAPHAFVNLDMEEYKDLALTIVAFTTVLDEAEFEAVDAGIVLQAYVPDSHDAMEHLGSWALARHVRGGGRIKVRLVKGANLAMEQVDAELHGWPQAPYGNKADVDASYKALLQSALRPAWAAAVRVGVASHNLFDIAWALTLRDGLVDQAQIEIEMLEGMAPAQARAVNAAAHGLLLYAPVVAPHDVDSSIAYLSRRLDENTSPDNFLRALFTLQPRTPAFAEQEGRFRESIVRKSEVSRNSNRSCVLEPASSLRFRNAADSDFTMAEVRARVAAGDTEPFGAPPHTDSEQAVDDVLRRAIESAGRFAGVSVAERRALLDAVAERMQASRYDSIAVMADEAGKVVREGDSEVSEAIDFARYYGTVGTDLVADLQSDGLQVVPRGVVLVVAPWNFPYAIAAGGVCAALAAGNAVVLKPAPEARRTAWVLASQMWAAGVPRDLLQYVACNDDHVGRHLVTHSAVETVVLTGSYDTALMFVGWKPTMRLLAETSGKNAMVITAAADMDAALRDLVQSAFGHAGQKCSAASLAIVEASVYDDPVFRQRLGDAVRSLRVDFPSNLAARVGPLIHAPSGALARALDTLDDHETWLVEPQTLGDPSNRLWSPGVKMGVEEESWFHSTECFGPVLGVMRADDLSHAIHLQNATAYGLTGGIQSLDPAEVALWLDRVEVGNAYVNRAITGAVVQRQPFGGWKRSSIGCGVKAGGPDYVLSLSNVRDAELPLEAQATSVSDAINSFDIWWQQWFSVPHDPSDLRSERNVLRYRALGPVVLRIGPDTPSRLVDVALAAAKRCGVVVTISNITTETEEQLCQRAAQSGIERVRSLVAVSDSLRLWLVEHGIGLDETAVSSHGRVELARWVKEQSISETTHRYGRITESALAARAASHAASASPMGVDGGAETIGHSSSDMRR